VGDNVKIIEAKPFSKRKKWEVLIDKWFKFKPN
jgi:ribosomal protein S17